MDYWNQVQDLLDNRPQLISYLSAGVGQELLESHLLADFKLGEFFRQQLEKLATGDREIEKALDRALEREEGSLEDLLWSPIRLALGREKWNQQASQAQVLANFKKSTSATIPWTFYRTDLPAAAGGGEELSNIPEELLQGAGLPSDAAILCQRRGGGYEIRLETPVPLRITMIFFQGEQELVRIKVNEQLPEVPLALEAISGWTHIQLIKEV